MLLSQTENWARLKKHCCKGGDSMNAISAAQSGAGLGLVSPSCLRGQTRSKGSDSTLNTLVDACRRSGGPLVLTLIEQFNLLLGEGAKHDVIVNAKQPDGAFKNQCRLTHDGETLTFEVYTKQPLR